MGLHKNAAITLAVLSVILKPHLAYTNSAASRCGESMIKKTATRRMFVFGGGSALAVGIHSPAKANARDILSSKPLEYIRIVRQEAADNLKYDGELAPISGQPASPAALLVPITRINALLKEIRTSIDEPSNWDELKKTLSSPPLSKKEFKQAFNGYADNIYYTEGSERANAYLAGGATPTTLQTTQYLLRNDILGNIEISVLELDFLIGLRDKGVTPRDELVGTELDDLRGFLDKALKSMAQYLAVANQDDLDLANAARLKRESSQWFAETK